jgi:hypothetical protein
MNPVTPEEKAAWREWNRERWEAVDTFRTQEHAALTDERVEQIILSLVAPEVWRERRDWSGLVDQQAIFHRTPVTKC